MTIPPTPPANSLPPDHVSIIYSMLVLKVGHKRGIAISDPILEDFGWLIAITHDRNICILSTRWGDEIYRLSGSAFDKPIKYESPCMSLVITEVARHLGLDAKA